MLRSKGVRRRRGRQTFDAASVVRPAQVGLPPNPQSGGETVTAPAPGSATVNSGMRDHVVDLEVGRRVHLLVGAALDRGASPGALIELCAELFSTWPTPRALAPSARLRCVTAAATYIGRCVPRGYGLVGVEEPLGHGIADLVWGKAGRLFVDELKSGSAEPADSAVRAQVGRLLVGGTAMWGTRFLGVRVVPLGCVRRAWIVTPAHVVRQPIDDADLEVR